LVRFLCSRWHGAHGRGRPPETMAPAHTLDLACAAQRRDDDRPVAARAGMAAETDIHLGRATAPHLDHALADPADGRDHRDIGYLRVLFEARSHRDPAWR